MFGSKTKDQSRVYAAPPPAEDGGGGNVEMGDMRKRAGSVSSEAPPVSADDEIALAYLSRYDTMSTSEYISETIMSMRDDFGGVETLDLHSAAFLGVPLVLAYYSVFLICLVYFTVVGVNSLTASKYLSLQGTNADQNCKEKPQTVTGFYLADYNGMWETFPGFEDNASLFTIKFTGSSLSDKQFTDVMASFQTKLAEYGAKAASRSVFYNALVWSTFSFYDDRFKIEFTSNVDAGTIAYNQFMNGAAWSSAYGICNVSYPSNIVGSYDQATKSYRMDIPLNLPRTYETDFNTHKTYKVPEPCPLQGKMSMFTSEVIRDASYYSPARFSLKFDARTIFAVIAMNLGIVDASKFTQTNSVYQPYVANKWPGTFYVDRLYVPMPAFFCIDKGAAVYGLNTDQQNGPEICFYVYEGNGPYGSAFLYPVGYHLKPENDVNGKPDNGNWVRCKCPQDKFARGCNRQDFYFMLFHRNDASTANNEKKMIQFGIKAQSFLVADPINGDKSAADYYSRVVALTNMISKEQLNPEKKFTSHIINRHLNSYTYGGASYYGDFMNFSYTRGMTWHEELTYEWRKICPDSGCSGIFFNSLAGPKMNNFQSVNSYNVQFGLLSNQTFYSPVLRGPVPLQMCVDTLSQSLAMSRLGAKPPVSLVQSYFECSNTISKALTTAIGSAAGSATLYTGIVMSVLGVVVVYVLNTFAARKVHANKYVKAVYTPLEKEIIILERERRMKVAMIDLLEELVDTVRQGGTTAADVDALERKLSAIKALDPRKSTVVSGKEAKMAHVRKSEKGDEGRRRSSSVGGGGDLSSSASPQKRASVGDGDGPREGTGVGVGGHIELTRPSAPYPHAAALTQDILPLTGGGAVGHGEPHADPSGRPEHQHQAAQSSADEGHGHGPGPGQAPSDDVESLHGGKKLLPPLTAGGTGVLHV